MHNTREHVVHAYYSCCERVSQCDSVNASIKLLWLCVEHDTNSVLCMGKLYGSKYPYVQHTYLFMLCLRAMTTKLSHKIYTSIEHWTLNQLTLNFEEKTGTYLNIWNVVQSIWGGMRNSLGSEMELQAGCCACERQIVDVCSSTEWKIKQTQPESASEVWYFLPFFSFFGYLQVKGSYDFF